jgi:hypothetical protein
MKNKIIQTSKSKIYNLPFASDKRASMILKTEGIEKVGWSFSNIYHFSELRDIYLKLKEVSIFGKTFKQYEDVCLKLPYISKPWNARRIEEYVNALKNFNVIDKHGRVIMILAFTSKIGESISSTDHDIFKKIFFTYFRFKEVIGWFVNPNEIFSEKMISEDLIKSKSKVVYTTSTQSRFTDTLFYELRDNVDLYLIQSSEDKSQDAMQRFWDVFCKWGIELGLLQKFNLDYFGCNIEPGKSISCCYFASIPVTEIPLKEFISRNFRNSYIHIPELVLKLCQEYRVSVEYAKAFIIGEYEKDQFAYSLDRTSEIFIRTSKIKTDSIKSIDVVFHPLYKGSYISHLTVLK